MGLRVATEISRLYAVTESKIQHLQTFMLLDVCHNCATIRQLNQEPKSIFWLVPSISPYKHTYYIYIYYKRALKHWKLWFDLYSQWPTLKCQCFCSIPISKSVWARKRFGTVLQQGPRILLVTYQFTWAYIESLLGHLSKSVGCMGQPAGSVRFWANIGHLPRAAKKRPTPHRWMHLLLLQILKSGNLVRSRMLQHPFYDSYVICPIVCVAFLWFSTVPSRNHMDICVGPYCRKLFHNYDYDLTATVCWFCVHCFWSTRKHACPQCSSSLRYLKWLASSQFLEDNSGIVGHVVVRIRLLFSYLLATRRHAFMAQWIPVNIKPFWNTDLKSYSCWSQTR